MITISFFWFGLWMLVAAWIGGIIGAVTLALVRNADTD